MFLHMLLMRDHGRARARALEPSSLVRSLLGKRLVCWMPDGERFAIVMTELGWRVAQHGAEPG